jgi:hypothetical protein
MAASFSFVVVYLALGHGVWTAQFLWRLPWALLCGFAGAGLGKLVATARARARLNQEIERLIAFQATPSHRRCEHAGGLDRHAHHLLLPPHGRLSNL